MTTKLKIAKTHVRAQSVVLNWNTHSHSRFLSIKCFYKHAGVTEKRWFLPQVMVHWHKPLTLVCLLPAGPHRPTLCTLQSWNSVPQIPLSPSHPVRVVNLLASYDNEENYGLSKNKNCISKRLKRNSQIGKPPSMSLNIKTWKCILRN